MLSKEVTRIIETAILEGKEVKVTVEINNKGSATESHPHDNKNISRHTGEIKRHSPPPLNSDMISSRPSVRLVNEGGCLIYIVACILSIGTTIYLL